LLIHSTLSGSNGVLNQPIFSLDVISFPPATTRRFENITPGDQNHEHILMFVIDGDGPRAEFTDKSMRGA
jgi:hypothetical protein